MKKFLKNTNFFEGSKKKDFVCKFFNTVFQYIKDSFKIKRTEFSIRRIVFIVIIGSILIGSAVFGSGKYQKFIDEKQKLEFQLAQVTQESREFQKGKEKAEEEAQQEAVKRSRAEARAKQEEFEKNIKEQQLSEKEAEERKMSADNDGDGLTYRRELELGTSDWNPDSDGDGIRDGEDAHPAGGGRYIAQHFEWDYKGSPWTWKHSIHEDWYEYYKNKPRTSHGLEYVTENDPFIKKISEMFKEVAKKEGYVVSLFITSFVQDLPYVQDAYTTFDDYPKYPIETFIERNGDCEDTSYLAASLVDASGYGSALVELPGHMAIAIKAVSDYGGYYYELADGRYYFFETTGEDSKLGDMPPEYLHKQAKITKVWDGKVVNFYPKYEKSCDSSPDFAGYYSDGKNFYSDSQCNNRIYCLYFKGFYIKPPELNFYHDSSCTQLVVKGCSKSTEFPGYFWDGYNWYYDSRCLNRFYPYGP